ncbi:MAG: HVO_0234 family beta-propeller protein [Halococcoides sp.]
MGDVSDDRVFDDQGPRATAYLGTVDGVVTLDFSTDRIGQIGLAVEGVVRDLAVVDGRVAVATAEDVLLIGDSVERTGFGEAIAVGGTDRVLAAGPEGRIARLSEGVWTTVGDLRDVRSMAGPYVGTGSGVYRADDAISYEGLVGVNALAGEDPGWAGTHEGLYRIADGGFEHDGVIRAVAADGSAVHAATAEALFERDPEGADGPSAWTDLDPPTEAPIAALAHGPAGPDGQRTLIGVTVDGVAVLRPAVSADGGTEWRRRTLGFEGIAGLVVR